MDLVPRISDLLLYDGQNALSHCIGKYYLENDLSSMNVSSSLVSLSLLLSHNVQYN